MEEFALGSLIVGTLARVFGTRGMASEQQRQLEQQKENAQLMASQQATLRKKQYANLIGAQLMQAATSGFGVSTLAGKFFREKKALAKDEEIAKLNLRNTLASLSAQQKNIEAAASISELGDVAAGVFNAYESRAINSISDLDIFKSRGLISRFQSLFEKND